MGKKLRLNKTDIQPSKSQKWREGLSYRGSMDANEQNDGPGVQVG